MTTEKTSTRRILLTGLLTSLAVSLAGCGNGGGASVIGMTPIPGATIDAGQSLPLVISVVNDVNRQGAKLQLVGDGSFGTPSIVQNGNATTETVNYIAPATVSAVDTATVIATSVRTPSQSISTTITINPALVFAATTLPNGTVGTAYSAAVTASGGTGTIAYTLSSGTLPAGVTLTPTTGALAGTPTTAGSYTFSITAKDASAVTTGTTQSYTVNIAPVVTTTTLPNATVGTAYSQQLTFSGGTTGTFALATGTLPAGLSLSATGAITGTATSLAAGTTSTFSVTVTVNGQTSAAQTLTIQVPAPPSVTTTTLPSGNVGVPYSQQLAYTGGNGGAVTWAITPTTALNGSGLTLSTTGLLSGTPTTATTYSFSVTITVGGQTSAAQNLTLVINSLIVTSATTAYGEVGLPFKFQASAAGGTGPYTWSLSSGTLPSPLTINSAGLITGTPTTAATTTGIVLKATDSLGATATQSMTLVVSAARASTLNAELNGQYAFLLTGFDANGAPLATAGKFTADGAGNITSGVLDTNGTALAAPTTNAALLTSTYTLGADGRGKLTLATASGTSTYLFAVGGVTSGVAGTGYLQLFDATGAKLTGTLALQTPAAFTTASLTGGYAFGASGYAGAATTSTPRHRSLAGEIQFNGTGSSTSAEYLSNATASATPTTPTSTAITIASNGRGTLTLTSSTGTLNFAVYVVSASKFFLLSTNTANTAATDLLYGQALQQTISNGNFSATSLNGVSVLQTEAMQVPTVGTYTPDIRLGLATTNGAGRITYSADENNAGTITTDSLAGTYTVAANGRVTLTLAAGLGGCTDCASAQSFFYLVGVNQGFMMDLNTAAVSGYFEPQTTATYALSSLSGQYALGTRLPLNTTATTATSTWVANGTGSITGSTDTNATTALSPDAPVSSTDTVAATGRALITDSTGKTTAAYIVSPTRFVLLDLSATSPVLSEATHQ